MTNADVYTTAWSLQQDFADRVMNQTCLSSVHPGIGTLPEICSGEYASRSSLVRSNRSFAFQ